MRIIITSPNLDPYLNVSGISSVTKFIIENNKEHRYLHIELGKRDSEKRGIKWMIRLCKSFLRYTFYCIFYKEIIVHFNYALNKASILRDSLFIFISRMLNVKTVIHIHGGDYLMRDIPRGLTGFFLKNVLDGFEKKIVLSDLERNELIRKYAVKNILPLPNCVSIPNQTKSTQYLNISNPVNVLFMGRLNQSKGLEVILKSFDNPELRKQKINFFCVGQGPDELSFKLGMERKIGSKFFFKGVLKGTEKEDLIAHCDIFLLPSLYGEGLPMALLETMAMGLVPIVTNDGSMGMVVKSEKNGVVINKSSDDELSNSIIKLVNNRAYLNSLSENARKTILNSFNPLSYIEKLNNLYEKE